MRDTHIRHQEDPAPLAVSSMGIRDLRYSWLPGDDPSVVKVRTEIQEEGRGLFVFRVGDTGVKVLCECHYPEDIRPQYYKQNLDRFRKVDHDMGRLVAVNEIFQWIGEIPDQYILEIRRNNRSARRELKREMNAGEFVREMDKAQEKEDAENSKDFEDFYSEAYLESVKFGMNRPRVSGYNPGGTR
jgi:hypothetical protein